jgi:hypothetical protein
MLNQLGQFAYTALRDSDIGSGPWGFLRWSPECPSVRFVPYTIYDLGHAFTSDD